MSELTQCNYCSLHAIRRRAAQDGKVVQLVLSRRGGDRRASWFEPGKAQAREVNVDEEDWNTSGQVSWNAGDHRHLLLLVQSPDGGRVLAVWE